MKRLIISLFALSFSLLAASQNMAVSTNEADYADMGTLNLGGEYGFARRWSAVAGFKYNPFSFGNGDYGTKRKRQQLYSAGLRFWGWHIFSGWWLSGKLQYQEYSQSGLKSRRSEEGDRFGGGFGGGYTYMLAPHLNLDFGLGFWAGYGKYVVYECPDCGRMTDSGKKFFLLPNDLIISLSYVF